MGDGDIRQLPFPPMWINAYIKEELLKYDFNNVFVVPSNPSAIDDAFSGKNTLEGPNLYGPGNYPDIAIQYDRLFRFRRTPFYPMKCEQLLYYIYSTNTAKLYDAMTIISQLLDRSDASAEDLNNWCKRVGIKDPETGYVTSIPYNIYFHDMKVYQLEETRDLGELGAIRGLTLNKLIIEYDYHIKEPIGEPEDRYR